jgi:hypothetical protein
MDDETKARIESLDKRLDGVQSRFDDVKWYIGGATGVFTLIFSVLTIMGSLNFNSQKEDLGRFETSIKTDLGKYSEAPEVTLLGPNRQQLSGQDVPGRIEACRSQACFNAKASFLLYIDFTISNSGNSSSGDMFVKLYSSEVHLFDSTSDEIRDKYAYEDHVDAKDLSPNPIPGKFSFVWHPNFWLLGEPPPPGRHPALVRVFYGNGRTVQAPITVVITAP